MAPTQASTAPAPHHAVAIRPRPTRVRYGVMAFLCALSFLTYFDRVCVMRAQKDIQRDLGIGDYRMGLVLGAFWFAYALFDIPSGWLGDRTGARKTLTPDRTRVVAVHRPFRVGRTGSTRC